MKGGVRELLKHYENDVFGRRNELTKKCENVKKTIDQYVERKLLDPRIKEQYVIISNLENMNSSTADTDEIVTEDQLTTTENRIAESQIQTIPVENVDHAGVEAQNDTDLKCEKTIDSSAMDINEKNPEIMQSKETSTLDLLKPLVLEPIDCDPEHIVCNVEERYKDTIKTESLHTSLLKTNNSTEIKEELIEQLKESEPSTKQNSTGDGDLLELGDNDKNAVLKEFDDDFNNFYASSVNINNLSNSAGPSTSTNPTYDNLVPIQTVLLDTSLSGSHEENPSNNDTAAQTIYVVNENISHNSDILVDNNNGYVYVQTPVLTDETLDKD